MKHKLIFRLGFHPHDVSAHNVQISQNLKKSKTLLVLRDTYPIVIHLKIFVSVIKHIFGPAQAFRLTFSL